MASYTYLSICWNLSQDIIDENAGVANSNIVDQYSDIAVFLIRPMRNLSQIYLIISDSVMSFHDFAWVLQEGGMSILSL